MKTTLTTTTTTTTIANGRQTMTTVDNDNFCKKTTKKQQKNSKRYIERYANDEQIVYILKNVKQPYRISIILCKAIKSKKKVYGCRVFFSCCQINRANLLTDDVRNCKQIHTHTHTQIDRSLLAAFNKYISVHMYSIYHLDITIYDSLHQNFMLSSS